MREGWIVHLVMPAEVRDVSDALDKIDKADFSDGTCGCLRMSSIVRTGRKMKNANTTCGFD